MVIVAAIATIVMIDQFIANEMLTNFTSLLMNFGVIIIGFMYLVGSGNLVLYLVRNVNRYETNDINKWLYIYTLVWMVFRFVTGVWVPDWYLWFSTNLRPGLGMSAITGCAIVLAAYRSFRFRSLESSVLLVFGLVTMLKLAPIGAVISPVFPALGDWMLSTLTRAANRGMLIGLGIGGMYTAIRTYFGLERRAIGV